MNETVIEVDGAAARTRAGVLARWSVPLVLMCCVVLAFFDKISIAVLFSDPQFQSDLGIGRDPQLMGALMTSFLLAYGLSSALLGFVGDLVSPRRCLVWLMLSWAVLMALMGLTNSYQSMLWLRVALGVAEGPLFALAYAIVKQSYPPRQQARATMLWLLGTPIGAALGFPITAYILGHFGWRASFFALAALTFGVIALVLLVLRGAAKGGGAAPHATGAAPAGTAAASHRRALLALFGNGRFWAVCLFNVAFLTYLWGLNSWLPTYLHDGKGIDLKSVGIYASLPFIGMLIGEVVGSIVSDRFDKRALQCLVSLACAGLGLFAVLMIQSRLPMIAAMTFSAMLWGLGAPNVFALLAKVVPAEVSATAGGVFNGAGNIAGSAAPLLIGSLIAHTGSVSAGILYLAAVALLGGLVLLPLVRRY